MFVPTQPPLLLLFPLWCWLHHNFATATAVVGFCCPRHHYWLIVAYLKFIFYFAIAVTAHCQWCSHCSYCHHPTAPWCCKQNYCCYLLSLLLSLPLVDCCFGFLFATVVVAVLPVCCHCSAGTTFVASCTTVLLLPLLLLFVVNITIVISHGRLLPLH